MPYKSNEQRRFFHTKEKEAESKKKAVVKPEVEGNETDQPENVKDSNKKIPPATDAKT